MNVESNYANNNQIRFSPYIIRDKADQASWKHESTIVCKYFPNTTS